MIALVFDGRVAKIDAEHPAPRIREPEARIRLRLAGVCNTDLEIARGYMGFRGVLGHEFVGDVIDSPDPAWIGRRVVGGINCACGRCERCARGLGNHCASRTVLGILGRDGVFAEEFLLPLANLHAVPDSVSDERAVFAEPLAAACRIQEQVTIGANDFVAVLGDGKLGLLIALVLARTAGQVVLFGRHPGRIALPAGVRERPADEVESAEFRSKFSRVVDATGSERGLAAALTLVRPLGTIVLKTTCHASHALSLAPIVIDEVTVVGSRCGPFPAALDFLAGPASDAPYIERSTDRSRGIGAIVDSGAARQASNLGGTIPVESLVHARFPLAQADHALARAGEPGALKVLIEGVRRS